jgi:STE24 endopeptidase
LNNLKIIILLIIIANYILARALDYLNNKNWSTVLPDDLAAFYDAEKYRKSQLYKKEKDRLEFWMETINLIILVPFLLMGGFDWLSRMIEPYFVNKIFLALAYFALLGVLAFIINLPFSLYATFGLEQKYGFNRTTFKVWILDLLKGLLLTIIIGGGLGYFVLWLIIQIGSGFWIYAWIAMAAFSIIANMFYSSLILPLINKLKPIE